MRCTICWMRWTPTATAMWTAAPMLTCWRRTSCGSPPAIPPALRIRSRCLPSRHRLCRRSWATPPRSLAPTTGYFVRAASSGRLNAGAADILAQSPEQLKAYLDSDPEMPLDGCVGKLVAGFSWQYAGVCSAKQAEKLLGSDGKPLRTAVEISFPGQSDAALRATVTEVTIDAEKDVARFVLRCNSINGDVLCLNHARARISTSESTGLRVPAAAVHYLKEDGTEAETQGENYIPGVYVKYGNIARFCKIDPVDADHPLVTEGDYILVLPKGTDGSVSQVRLYDEIIVSGQNLYDGKLL